jgi:hypothetical protein
MTTGGWQRSKHTPENLGRPFWPAVRHDTGKPRGYNAPMNDPAPLPAQVLEYQSVVNNPWPGVMRIVGLTGLLYSVALVSGGAAWVFQIATTLSTAVPMFNLVSLLSVPPPILILAASWRILRFHDPGRLLIWGCWSEIAVSAAASLLSNSTTFKTLYGTAWTDSSILLLMIFRSTVSVLSAAAFPLTLLLLFRHLRRYPQFQASMVK